MIRQHRSTAGVPCRPVTTDKTSLQTHRDDARCSSVVLVRHAPTTNTNLSHSARAVQALPRLSSSTRYSGVAWIALGLCTFHFHWRPVFCICIPPLAAALNRAQAAPAAAPPSAAARPCAAAAPVRPPAPVAAAAACTPSGRRNGRRPRRAGPRKGPPPPPADHRPAPTVLPWAGGHHPDGGRVDHG